MAILVPTENPERYMRKYGQTWEEWHKVHDEIWEELAAASKGVRSDDESLNGFLLTFPVADGRAIYRIVSTQPLKIEHIPLGDAYRIPDAHIRGLNLDDARKQVRFHEFWNNIPNMI